MRDFQVKLVVCAALAAMLPTAALLARGLPSGGPAAIQAGLAMGGSLMAVFLMVELARHLGLASRVLRQCLGEEAVPPALDAERAPDAGGLIAQAAELTVRLEAMRHRLMHRHPVTGLPTREPFLADLAEDMQGADKSVLLGIVRFDDFARLCAFDQAAADRALKAFSDRLTQTLDGARAIAQVDRDSFAVWFANAQSPTAAAGELEAISYVLTQELVDGEMRLSPDVSMAAAVFPEDGTAPSELLTRAMAALSVAQGSGKLAFFSPASSNAERERFALEQELRTAVSKGQFLLHFQPLVDLGAGKVIGAEALLRWQHPTMGLVPPGRFIPILEQSGRMEEVGLWIINAACREARSWREHGLNDLKMAVNLSTTQCRDPKLRSIMLKTLDRYGLEPASLELELTETTAMEDAGHTRQLLTQLREDGVGVAIDDFGSGYSSLSYLKNLPFTKLKIDREFVEGVHERRDSAAICSALIELARGLEIEVLAEGVETLDELAALQAMGCRLFQGYLFARPMEGAQFIRTLKDPDWLAQLASPARLQMGELVRRTSGLTSH